MNEEERTRFGEYIASLRKKHGLTLRDVEADAGISPSYLSQIEKGIRNPPRPDVLRRMARLYKVNLSVLMVAAGYQDREESELYDHDAEVERAFRYVVEDPNYQFGTHMGASELTIAAKKFVLEVYADMTGTDLLARFRKKEESRSGNDCGWYNGNLLAFDFEMAFSFLHVLGSFSDPWNVDDKLAQAHVLRPTLRFKVRLFGPFRECLEGLSDGVMEDCVRSMPGAWQDNASRIIDRIRQVRIHATRFENALNLEVQR